MSLSNQNFKQIFELAFDKHQKNNLKEAEILYNKILKNTPNHFQSTFLLGTLCGQLKKYEVAVTLLKKATHINPNYLDAHNNLGNVYREKGLSQKAISCYQKALRINPNYQDANNNLGNIFYEIRKYPKAISCYQKTLQINPKDEETHNKLGLIFKKQGKLQDALNSFQKAIKINPHFENAYYNLGNIFALLEKQFEAIKCYQKVIDLNSNSAEAYNLLGIQFSEIRNYDESISYYKKAIKINSNYLISHYNLLEIYERKNDMRKFKNHLSKYSESVFKNNPIINIFKSMILIRKNQFKKAKILLDSYKINEYKKIPVYYKMKYFEIIAKIYDRLNDANTAFKYYSKINSYEARIVSNNNFNKKNILNEIKKNKKYFKSKNILKWRKINIPNTRSSPVFLIGFPRSGTTLLDTILSSHSLVKIVEEKKTVEKMKTFFNDFSHHSLDKLNNLSNDNIQKMRLIYYKNLDYHLQKNEKKNILIIDKLPLNIIEVGFIHRIFPKSIFIFVLRHPCDCVLSCFMNRFRMNDAMANFVDLNDTINFYNKIMSLWIQITNELPINFISIKYENIVKNLKDTVKPLLNYFNLEWEKSIYLFNKTALNKNFINTPSYNQVINPLYNQAIGRWEKYEEIIKIYPKLEKWIKKFNYEI